MDGAATAAAKQLGAANAGSVPGGDQVVDLKMSRVGEQMDEPAAKNLIPFTRCIRRHHSLDIVVEMHGEAISAASPGKEHGATFTARLGPPVPANILGASHRQAANLRGARFAFCWSRIIPTRRERCRGCWWPWGIR